MAIDLKAHSVSYTPGEWQERCHCIATGTEWTTSIPLMLMRLEPPLLDSMEDMDTKVKELLATASLMLLLGQFPCIATIKASTSIQPMQQKLGRQLLGSKEIMVIHLRELLATPLFTMK